MQLLFYIVQKYGPKLFISHFTNAIILILPLYVLKFLKRKQAINDQEEETICEKSHFQARLAHEVRLLWEISLSEVLTNGQLKEGTLLALPIHCFILPTEI